MLAPKVRRALGILDDELYRAWNLGENIILVWTHEGGEFRFLSVRHYAIIEAFDSPAPEAGAAGAATAFVNGILAGSKFVAPPMFDSVSEAFGKDAQILRLKLLAGETPSDGIVSRLVTRYGVSLVRERAVVLLDAVGFSLKTPLEQVAMLNSLSYSVNSAYGQLLSRDVRINFARTTTGDGFYIWSRVPTVQANIALYKLMMLILSDNAIAQRKARRFPVPRLRAAYHVGEHYEFYQVEALNPTTFSYIVGQVTVDLSRMIEWALPGQILIGDFNIEMHDAKSDSPVRYGTLDFVAATTGTLDELRGLVVADDAIESIRCYLTGAGAQDGDYRVNRYRIQDKHGVGRLVYNAKINIHRAHDEPIFLGIQHRDLHPEGAGRAAWSEVDS